MRTRRMPTTCAALCALALVASCLAPRSEDSERYEIVMIAREHGSVVAIVVDTTTGEWKPIDPFTSGSWEHPSPKKGDD